MIEFVADLAEVGRCRDVAGAFLARHHAEREVSDDLGLAVSELVSNAIQHGSGSSGTVRVVAERDRFVLEVSGADGVPDPAGRALPPPTDSSGRGLVVVQAVTDGLEFVDVDGERAVRCVRFR